MAEYVEPTPLEVTTRDSPKKRQLALAYAIEQTQHWQIMGDPTRVTAWQAYHQQIYALVDAPAWPLVEHWPEAPQ